MLRVVPSLVSEEDNAQGKDLGLCSQAALGLNPHSLPFGKRENNTYLRVVTIFEDKSGKVLNTSNTVGALQRIALIPYPVSKEVSEVFIRTDRKVGSRW